MSWFKNVKNKAKPLNIRGLAFIVEFFVVVVCEFLLSNKMNTSRAMRVNLQHKTNVIKIV